jgi:hypothetical protein
MRIPTPRCWSSASIALAAAIFSSGCQSLDSRPTAAAATIAGDWRIDSANSDDFDRQLALLLQQVHRREQPRQPLAGQSAAGAGRAQIDPLIMPPEDPVKMRSRLADDLRPAAALRIAVISDGIELTRDAEPTRQFLPAQTVSRIDSSGAASVECGWEQNAFVIRAKYTNRGARSWRLERDTATDTLHVTFSANSPEYGHLELHTLYRRAAGAAP